PKSGGTAEDRFRPETQGREAVFLVFIGPGTGHPGSWEGGLWQGGSLVEEQIKRLHAEAEAALAAAQDGEALERVRVRYLGKKGELTQLLRGLGQLDPQERPRVGQLVNQVRDQLQEALQRRQRELAAVELQERLRRET